MPISFVEVSGEVLNQETQEPIVRAELKFRDNLRKLNIIVYTDSEGKYDVKLEANSDYTLSATKANFLNRSIDFKTKDEPSIDLTFSFSKLEAGAIYILDGLRFTVNSTDLESRSSDALYFLKNTLKRNTAAKLNIFVHTDSRGNKEYNLRLTELRAQKIKEELVGMGIDPLRINTYGYGEKFPLNHCMDGVLCNSESHAMNRRTEISFLNL